VKFHPNNANYPDAFQTAQVTVNPGTQTIAFNPVGAKTYGDSSFSVSVTGAQTSVTYSTSSTACTVSPAGSVTIVSAGSCVINAVAAVTTDWNTASAQTTVSVGQASSTTTITCPASVTYTGSALTPCTATVTGAGGLSQAVTVSYSNNTNVGTATANANFGGDANHTSSSDSKTFAIGQASSTTSITCPASVTYTGSALTPCTASVTGAGALSQSLTVSYSNNTDAGTATANASYAGDSNHASSSDSKTFVISQASSTTTVTCPANVTYNGSAQTPCTAAVTGAGGLNQSLTVSYSNNANAGTASASASFAGDGNHTSSSDSKTFTIDQASSTTAITCPANVTYTGAAQTPCTAIVTGSGGLNQSVTVTYSSNTNAGTATANANFAGDANHTSSSDSKTFSIDQASSSTTITCPANVTYTGAPLTPCSATVTGAGGLNQSVAVTYGSNTNVGTATANANFAGDANHTSSSDSKTFAIDQAPSTTTITCPASVIYTGSALTPCTASVTGSGGLSQSLTVYYSNNTNAGTATANASYAGDGNHTGSNDSKTFVISPAASITTVNCPASVTYTGATLAPCTASVIGAGGLNQALTVGYSNNTSVGTASASASYAGDANHASSSDSKNFSITKQAQTITFTQMVVSAEASSGSQVSFTTNTLDVCTVTAGVQVGQTSTWSTTVTLNPSRPSGKDWKDCNVVASQQPLDPNYSPASATAVLGTPAN
jgi:hypothetical protein